MKTEIRIFISYAREDQGRAREIHQRLVERGYKPWLDEEDLLPGQDFRLVIEKSLTSSDFVIICLSKSSVAKRSFFQREIKYALDKLQEMRPEDIFVIPARLDDCQMPDELKNRHWVNLFEDRGWEKLFKAIEIESRNRGNLPEHTVSSQTTPDFRRDQQIFQFTTAQLDERGDVIERKPGQARGLVEDLGGGAKIEMIELAGGEFWMGSTDAEAQTAFNEVKRYFKGTQQKWYTAETPRHRVAVSSFLMGKHPVTQAQWMEVMGNLPEIPDNLRGDEHPVVMVSWEEADAFCQELSRRTKRKYRLPTEAEWEYACRAGTTSPFAFGQNINPEIVNYAGSHPYGSAPKGIYRQKTVPVGSLGVANAFGLCDMHGNVWEWCSDWYDSGYYEECRKQGVAIDPQGPGAGSFRVLRGGGWSSSAVYCRSAFRHYVAPGNRYGSVGFRLVRVGR